jgi:hypothetical protein
MGKHRTKYILVIVVVIVGLFILWKTGGTGLSSEGSLSKELTAGLGKAQIYDEADNNFTFSYLREIKNY